MKQILLKTWLILVCLLTGAGTIWGADATFTFSTQGYTNAQVVTSGTIDTYTSWSATKGGSNDPAYYSTGSGLRVYNGGTFSITSTKTIASITLTFSTSGYTFSTSNTTTPQTVTPNATSYSWDVSRTCRLQKIEITYASGGGTTPTKLGTPTNLSASNVTATSATLSWDAVANASSYTVKIGETEYTSVTTNSYSAAGLTAGTQYTWTVKAVGDGVSYSTSAYAANANFTTEAEQGGGDEPSGEKLTLELTFVTHPVGWPVAKNNAAEGSYNYTLNNTTYSFTHTKVGDGIYLAGTSKTSGYLLMAADNKLGLPAIEGYKLTRVVGTLNDQGTPSTSSQVSITDGTNTITGGTSQTWSTKGDDYTYELTGTTTNTVYYMAIANKNCQMIALSLTYEADDTPAKLTPTLSFANPTYNATFGETFVAPTLTNEQDVTVSYSSSKPEVATVNPSTGEISLVALGTTKITASFEGNEDFDPASASYDLVVEAPVTDKTIAEFIENKGGKCYLTGIVSNIANTTYGNFDLTDETGTVFIYGCLNSEGEEKQFASLEVVAGDKIKVIANEYDVYHETAEAKNVIFVEIVEKGATVQYDVIVTEGIANGNVTASAEKAAEGDVVTLTATPNAGYELQKYIVTRSDNNEDVTVTNNRFTMPAANVSVTATFAESSVEPEPEPQPGEGVTYTFASFDQANDVELKADGYTITLHKNTGSTAPQWNGNSGEARVYAKGSVDVTSTKNIVKVVYNYDENAGGKNNVVPTIDGVAGGTNTGTWSAGTKTWTGSDTKVTLTTSGSAGNLGFKSITVYFEEEAQPEHGSLNFVATNTDGYWATFTSTDNVIFDASDVIVYTVAVDEDGKSLVRIDANNNSLSCVTDKTIDDGWVTGYYVQAGAAVLINSINQSVNYYYIDTDPYTPNQFTNIETDPEYNMLRPASVPKEETGYLFYKLAYGDWDNKTKLGFWWGAADGGAFESREGGVYLAVPASAGASNMRGFSFDFEGRPTGIENICTDVVAGEIYNLQGQRINRLQQGVNIVNGRKVIR